jgi:hypothetical protein
MNYCHITHRYCLPEKLVPFSINPDHAAAKELLDIAFAYYEFAKSARRFIKF